MFWHRWHIGWPHLVLRAQCDCLCARKVFAVFRREIAMRAAALQPKVGIHQGGRANALDALGRTDAAREAQRRALDLDPSLGWMWSGREG